MRRIPNPVVVERSLLEDVPPEDIERRILENSFDVLDEDKGLFFVFQHLQAYLSVDGAVLNFRFEPQWGSRDGDGRYLFRDRDHHRVRRAYLHEEEVRLNRPLALDNFTLHVKKLVLDAHSQAVSSLFLDQQRDLLWVARNDGFLTLFSTKSKYVVTCLAHPCAEKALGPPDAEAWAKQLHQFLKDSQYMTFSPRLKKHKESEGFPAARFIGFLPFCNTMQFSCALVFQREVEPGKLVCDTEVRLLDGRANLSSSDRAHERHMNVFLNYLKMCRQNANSVRKAQRDFYMQSKQRTEKTDHRRGQCRGGLFADLHILKGAFSLWQQHNRIFHFEHTGRRLREGRCLMKQQNAKFVLSAHEKDRLLQIFTKWQRWAVIQQAKFQYETMHSFVRSSQKRLRRPSKAAITRLGELNRLQAIFRGWENLVPRNRQTAPLYQVTSLLTYESGTAPPKVSLHSSRASELSALVKSISMIYNARCYVLSNAESLILEDWIPILENAESAALSDDLEERKIAVLSYGLVPLLQGFLSSSDSILSNLHNSSVKKEAVSMMSGILLCLDFIIEDPEETLVSLVREGKVSMDVAGEVSSLDLHFTPSTAVQEIIFYFAEKLDRDELSLSDFEEHMEDLESLFSYIELA